MPVTALRVLASVSVSRRVALVIAKIEWHPGELFPRVGFFVSNLPMEPDWVVRFCNQRGAAEQHLLGTLLRNTLPGNDQGRQIRLSLDAAVMPEVPRQRGAAATARVGLRFGNFLALHQVARGDGGLVIDQPATQADQDRRPSRASRSRHLRRDPPIASTSVMRVIAIHAQTERKRQEKSVRRAEKHRLRAKTRRFCRLIRPVPAAHATAGAARGAKCLSSARNPAILASDRGPLGECRFNKEFDRLIKKYTPEHKKAGGEINEFAVAAQCLSGVQVGDAVAIVKFRDTVTISPPLGAGSYTKSTFSQ